MEEDGGDLLVQLPSIPVTPGAAAEGDGDAEGGIGREVDLSASLAVVLEVQLRPMLPVWKGKGWDTAKIDLGMRGLKGYR